ncbi:hypothetical protein BDV95DRAFT_606070 [Massariosphaeria phaeospora]|uniref:BTB domain-containing protein n=1 Tax=Massariosphaeria phaeospora TaxID=100035 RepID=A0A7C8M9J0_9PLEO|nr:hypothetical protein BDV95DRAFT_606070 [Massariosphaeria phaeospora]
MAATSNSEHGVSVYSMSQKLVYFDIDDERFVVHADLLDHHSETWKTAFDEETAGTGVHIPCTSNPISPVFRGFVHWLYRQELPTEEIIKRSKFPPALSEGKENQPLTCSMAIELYFFGHDLGMQKLCNDAVTFLFLQYTN